MKKTIESKIAATILEKKREITIGDTTYQVAPPSTATLIEVSGLVAQLPQINLNPDDMISECVMVARECRVLGDIIAVMILGEGNYIEERTVTKKRFFGLKTEVHTIRVDRRAEITKEALKMTPKKLGEAVFKLLGGLEIAAFFALTTSLIEINLTRPTKEVVETIASGR